MKRLVALVLAGLLMAGLLSIGFVVGATSTAGACDIADPFLVSAEHLADGDFNSPDSRLALDYREWSRDDTATIEITGVYVYETVYSIDAEGDWSSGSLNVPMEIWGEWPADTSADAIEPRKLEGDVPSCGWGPTGRAMGTRVYSVVASDTVDFLVNDDADAILAAAFGAPEMAPRDNALERDLIAEIDAARASSTRLFVGIGVAAIAMAAIVMRMGRRSAATASAEPEQ